MRALQDWLNEYGESHQNRTNKVIHWICLPLIIFSLILMLWAIPVPDFMMKGGLNWGYVALWGVIGYYFFLSPPLGIGMMVVLLIMIYLANTLMHTSNYAIWKVGLVIFVTAWIGQFIGHRIEGKKPSFLKDIQFLLIGPLWLLQFIYKKIGLPI